MHIKITKEELEQRCQEEAQGNTPDEKFLDEIRVREEYENDPDYTIIED